MSILLILVGAVLGFLFAFFYKFKDTATPTQNNELADLKLAIELNASNNKANYEAIKKAIENQIVKVNFSSIEGFINAKINDTFFDNVVKAVKDGIVTNNPAATKQAVNEAFEMYLNGLVIDIDPNKQTATFTNAKALEFKNLVEYLDEVEIKMAKEDEGK